MNKREFGNLSELKALGFLQSRGFVLLEKNFFIQGGEIDLIFQKDDFIVFVEVKSLNTDSERDIYSTLTKSKRKRLKKTINYWLSKNNKQDLPWRLDFIGISFEKDKIDIEHFEFVSLEN